MEPHSSALGARNVILETPFDDIRGFAASAGVDPARLEGCVDLTGCIPASPRALAASALELYLAMRRGRASGHAHYVSFVDEGDATLARLLGRDQIRGARRRAGTQGPDRNELAVHGRLDDAMLRCFDVLTEEQRAGVRGEGFTEEIREAAVAGASRFAEGPFWAAARSGTLTRAQYVRSLANHHQFVRYTTRILGLAVGACEDLALRAHYAHHLGGEVHHEVWIEEDLAYLGADVDFVQRLMVPDAPIMKFNFVQEALVSFRRDPVVFLGVPIAIEGASAFMPVQTIEAIRSCMRGWGYAEPERGTRFLGSHIDIDAGHAHAGEGHWAGTLRVMKDRVRTERQQQEILRIVQLEFEALESAYTGYVAGPDL